ncbi:MAG: hypothetical protein BAJALOKI1v1_730014 [Promethearchaeota archaeon]|nr:MAG: hypothetical protein BAJALOKI1v1_730014 [Candidatus Lokiarchaeota archaeon]
MEIFNKLKEYFGQTPIESLKELEKELMELQNKFKSGFVSIIGYSGRMKGLPLIYQSDEEKRIKRITANLVNSLESMKEILSHQTIENVNIHWTENILYFRKITKEIGIISLLQYGKDINKLKDWVGENLSKIEPLFH